MTGEKRRASGEAEVPSKKTRVEPAFGALSLDGLKSVLDAARPIEEKLLALERECMRAQMKIQMEFNEKKSPLLKERDAVLEKTDGFWGAVVTFYGPIAQMIIPKEVELLQNHLKKVVVNDHLDENGSYEVIFEFKDSAKDIFSPLVLTKRVVFNDDESINEEKTQLTKATFTKSEDDPRELVRKMWSSNHDDNCECAQCQDNDFPEESIFNWFGEVTLAHPVMADFGEIIRRVVYPTPEQVFVDDSSDDSSDDEDA